MASSRQEPTFTLFPKLPLELRLRIWEYTLPGPRVVNIRQRKLKRTIGEWEAETGSQWPLPPGYSETESDVHMSSDAMDYCVRERTTISQCDPLAEQHLTGIINDAPFPNGVPYVCQESYEVVAKWYTRSFRSLGSVASTWFNFDSDILYLDHQNFSVNWRTHGTYIGTEIYALPDELKSGYRMLDLENLRRVKKLAIRYPWYWSDCREGSLAGVFRAFGNIEELFLVLDDGHVARESSRSLIREPSSFRTRKPLAREELFLVEPINYGQTQSLYQHFSPSHCGFDRLVTEVPSPIMFDTGYYAPLDIVGYKALLQRGIKQKNSYDWKVPTISLKIVLGKHYKELLEMERANCEKKIAHALDRQRELETLSFPERLDYLRLIEAEDNEEEEEEEVYCDPEDMLYEKDEEDCYTPFPTLEDYC